MKTKTRSPKTSPIPFETGQIWQVGSVRLKIGLVGKRLVHYKHCKGTSNATPVLLSAKTELEKLLRKQHAVLVSPAAPLHP